MRLATVNKKRGSFVLHLPIFYLLGFWWDDQSRPQMCWDRSQLLPSQSPTIHICLTRIIFCTKNKMYIHFNNFCIGILLGCPFKTWSTIGKVKVLFELQFNHYIYDMGGVRKWLLFGILLEFLCTLRPQCWEYKFVEIYICIEYMLPTIWGIHISWIYMLALDISCQKLGRWM